MKIKDSLALIDDDLLSTLFEVAQFALNDIPTIQRVSDELQITEEKVEVLTGLAIDLSCGQLSADNKV